MTDYAVRITRLAYAYPDGANLYLSDGVKKHLSSRGLTTPIVATGKIRTPELAESVLTAGKEHRVVQTGEFWA